MQSHQINPYSWQCSALQIKWKIFWWRIYVMIPICNCSFAFNFCKKISLFKNMSYIIHPSGCSNKFYIFSSITCFKSSGRSFDFHRLILFNKTHLFCLYLERCNTFEKCWLKIKTCLFLNRETFFSLQILIKSLRCAPTLKPASLQLATPRCHHKASKTPSVFRHLYSLTWTFQKWISKNWPVKNIHSEMPCMCHFKNYLLI